MKQTLILSFIVLCVVTFGSIEGIYAQKWKDALKSAGNALVSTPNDTNKQKQPAAEQPQDTIDAKAFLEEAPVFTVKKLTMLNAEGDTMRYEDGSIQYHYIVYDKTDQPCDPELAKQLTNQALKDAAIILAKVAGGAAGGGIVGGKLAKDKKKGAIIGGVIGGTIGLVAASGDIKNVKEKTSLLKKYKAELKKYQGTFTEEGLPIDATADLSEYEDCEELTANAQEVKEKLLASQAQCSETGGSLDEISDDELDKLLKDA